jgi:hypothetical protein
MNSITIESIIELQKNNVGILDISKIFNVSKPTIYKMLRKYNLPTQNEIKNNEFNISRINTLYDLIKCTKKVSKEIGLSPSFVRKILIKSKNANYIFNKTNSPDKTRRKHKINVRYFDSIDSETKSYILGFIYADGTVDNYRLKIAIHSKDFYVIDHFLQDISTEKTSFLLHSYQEMKEVSVCSTYLSKSLHKIGCVPNKTFILNNLPTAFIQHELMNHFIRGYFDGDGCAKYKHGKLRALEFAGCRNFLNNVNKYLHDNIKTSLRNIYDLNNNPLSGTLSYTSADDILKLGNFLYKDATLFLHRKKDRFDAYYNIQSKKISNEVLIATYTQEKSILKVSKVLDMPFTTVYSRMKKICPHLLIHKQRKQKQQL